MIGSMVVVSSPIMGEQVTDLDVQVAGRLSALEYVLEVLLANELAFQPEDATEAFKQDLLARPGYIKRGPVDADRLALIEVECATVLGNFVDKVSSREAEIRSRLD